MESSGGSRAWLIAASAVVVLYGVVAVLIRVAPDNGIDRSVLDWVTGLDTPFLDTVMERVSWFTDLRPRLVVGFIGVVGIALSGHHRLAAMTAAAAIVAAIAVNGSTL